MNPFFIQDVLKLYGVARREGQPLLIDSQEEWNQALTHLEKIPAHDEKEKKFLVDLKSQLLQLGPGSRIQINPLFRTCGEDGRGCYEFFIPLPPDQAIGFFSFSGGVFQSAFEFVPMANEEWENMISPLKTTASSAASERELIRQVVDRILQRISPEPCVSGQLVEELVPLFSGDPIKNAAEAYRTSLQILFALQQSGLLRHHRFELFAPTGTHVLGPPVAHLVEKGAGTLYLLDACMGRNNSMILSEQDWKLHVWSSYGMGKKQ